MKTTTKTKIMKTLKDIQKGFEKFDIQKVELENNLTYYFTDYTDMQIPSIKGFIVGKISRYTNGYESSNTWYYNQNKFEKAIKRHLQKQKTKTK